MQEERVCYWEFPRAAVWSLLATVLLYGCSHAPTNLSQRPETGEVIVLDEITSYQAKTFLDDLDLCEVSLLPDRNSVLVTGSPAELRKAGVVLELIDAKDKFVVETLAPAVTPGNVEEKDEFVEGTASPRSVASTLPSNDQIAQALDDIAIGTFTDPPRQEEHSRAIIDVRGDRIVAIVPERRLKDILEVIESGVEVVSRRRETLPPRTQAKDGTTQTAADKQQAKAGTADDRQVVQPGAGEDRRAKPAPDQAPVPLAESGKSRTKSSVQVEAEADSAADVEVVATEEVQGVNSSVSASRTSAESREEPTPGRPPVRLADPGESSLEPSIQANADADSAVGTEAVTEEETQAIDKNVPALGPTADSHTEPNSQVQEGTAKISARDAEPPATDRVYQLAPLANGDDILQLDLPDRIDLIRLLDLVGEYLHLDYVYDPDKIKNEMVTLKLQGKRRGQIRVKELYSLLESVLNFKGYVMTRREGNLVAIVPVLDALQVDPQLVDPNDRTLRAGNIVVTRTFQLKHVDTFSAVSLLENMRLTVAVSPVEETQTLIITCYAYRMNRIERLLAIIDRPGRLRKVRFRQLQYITANMLAEKVEALAAELETAGVTIALAAQRSAQSGGPLPAPPFPAPSASRTAGSAAYSGQTVYLDADDRTNRIVMIGYEEQLETVEELIDAFDVPQQGLLVFQVYELVQVEAAEALDKLQELGIIGEAAPAQRTPSTPPAPTKPSPPFAAQAPLAPGGPLVEEPRVVLLEATNALLVGASREQHAQIAEIIGYIDKVRQDIRILKVYDIEHIDTKEARAKLAELQICDAVKGTSEFGPAVPQGAPAAANPSPSPPSRESATAGAYPRTLFGKAQVVVVESTNSLLVITTAEQHEQIETVLGYVDCPTREEEIPYKIYPLENSSPSHLAEVLGKLIEDAVQDEEDKIERVVEKKEEITLVPDPNTYSLIVYANRKNQEWISDLLKQLDKRRSQVLIEATLVEVTKADAFSYDLSLLRSSKDLDSTSGVTGVGTDPNAIGKFIEWGSGALSAFYGDREIQILLSAMQSKSYGRVLAKPKLLVNDNEAGTIKTTDTTYVETKSGIPVSSGAVGDQQNFVETSIQYEPYEAGITLEITPHISEGNLLRLEIVLTRSDFLKTVADKPPDTRSNEVDTAVTLPDGSTIILGGLLKMNQVKGGSKVPILGDIPIIGGLFRSVNNEDVQSKLYVFVKAEIIRPAETEAQGMKDLERISDRSRLEFEKHEDEFQGHQNWPGIKPKPVKPPKVLDAQ